MGLILILTNSCKKEDNSSNNKPPIIKLGPNTIWTDDETAQTIKTVDSAKIVFNGNTSQLQNFKVGSIIVSGIAPNAPYGYMRKITDIKKIDSEYIIKTTEVPLTEAFEELNVDYTKIYAASDTGHHKLTGIEFNINFPNVIIYDADGNKSTTHDQVKLNGNLLITPEITVKININWFKLTYAKIGGSFTKQIDRTIIAGGSLIGFDKSITVYEQPLSPMVIPSTPIVIIPTLSVKVGANGSISAQVSFSDVETSTSGIYLEYYDGNWSKTSVKTMTNQTNFSGYIGNINAKAYIEPSVNFKFFGSNWAKGSFFIDVYSKLNAQLVPYQPCVLTAGINGGAEANLKFFSWDFASASYPNIFDFSKVIYTCDDHGNLRVFVRYNTIYFQGATVQIFKTKNDRDIGNVYMEGGTTDHGGGPTDNYANFYNLPYAKYYLKGTFDEYTTGRFYYGTEPLGDGVWVPNGTTTFVDIMTQW